MTHDFLQRPGSSRPQRVGDEVQRELARLLQFEVKDPRLGMVTITSVEVAKDLSYADVWYTVLKGEPENSQKALDSAAGFLRTQIGRAIKFRMTPHLRFRFDAAPSRGIAMSELIDKARAEDRQIVARHDDDAVDSTESAKTKPVYDGDD